MAISRENWPSEQVGKNMLLSFLYVSLLSSSVKKNLEHAEIDCIKL